MLKRGVFSYIVPSICTLILWQDSLCIFIILFSSASFLRSLSGSLKIKTHKHSPESVKLRTSSEGGNDCHVMPHLCLINNRYKSIWVVGKRHVRPIEFELKKK